MKLEKKNVFQVIEDGFAEFTEETISPDTSANHSQDYIDSTDTALQICIRPGQWLVFHMYMYWVVY